MFSYCSWYYLLALVLGIVLLVLSFYEAEKRNRETRKHQSHPHTTADTRLGCGGRRCDYCRTRRGKIPLSESPANEPRVSSLSFIFLLLCRFWLAGKRDKGSADKRQTSFLCAHKPLPYFFSSVLAFSFFLFLKASGTRNFVHALRNTKLDVRRGWWGARASETKCSENSPGLPN